jgi:hypothetical protein
VWWLQFQDAGATEATPIFQSLDLGRMSVSFSISLSLSPSPPSHSMLVLSCVWSILQVHLRRNSRTWNMHTLLILYPYASTFYIHLSQRICMIVPSLTNTRVGSGGTIIHILLSYIRCSRMILSTTIKPFYHVK